MYVHVLSCKTFNVEKHAWILSQLKEKYILWRICYEWICNLLYITGVDFDLTLHLYICMYAQHTFEIIIVLFVLTCYFVFIYWQLFLYISYTISKSTSANAYNLLYISQEMLIFCAKKLWHIFGIRVTDLGKGRCSM